MNKQPTHDIWTSGIVNVPLANELKNSRYTFFELDTKNVMIMRKIVDWYIECLDSVYVHETMNGYHFYNLTPIHKEYYGMILRAIKQFNPLCPMTTLRIIPNKWKNEYSYWSRGAIIGAHNTPLMDFMYCIENVKTDEIRKNYQVVNYKFDRKEVIV